MSFSIKTIPVFERQAKRLVKKYPSLKDELIELVKVLKAKPKSGVCIGHSCYKIRLAIASKGKGKSGGARVVTYVWVEGQTVYLISIYDKQVKDSISDKEIIELLGNIGL